MSSGLRHNPSPAGGFVLLKMSGLGRHLDLVEDLFEHHPLGSPDLSVEERFEQKRPAKKREVASFGEQFFVITDSGLPARANT